MINCFYDCYRILNKVYSEKAFIKQAFLDVDIEEKNRALTTKICYGVLDTDIELSYYIKYFAEKSPKLAIRTVLKIAMYNLKYLEKKDYAVIDNAVELVKKLGKGGASGFVNAFLRKFVKNCDSITFPTDLAENLSVRYSYPLFAVKKLLEKYKKDRTEQIISSKNTLTSIVFYDTDGKDYLDRIKVEYSDTPFNNVFLAKNFVRNEDYDKGIYTFQALGSVAITEEVDGVDRVLDCCSAPGGKAIRLSYKCNKVYAWDIYPHRVELINEYAKRLNRKNIITEVKDSKVFEEKYKDFFDEVLCDAPCSGLGVINDNPDIRINRTEEDVYSLIKEQKVILNNVCKYVKVGGNLVYSTCSILDDENINVIKWFIENNKNFVIEQIKSKLNHEEIEGTNLFMPDISNGLGFYCAKLKRIK